MHHTITGVDLAKDEIQVCATKHNKVHSNKAMTPIDFSAWLASSKKMIIVFEACGTSNYWKQCALEYGHDARLISEKLVASVRQNQTVRTAFAMLSNGTVYKAESLTA